MGDLGKLIVATGFEKLPKVQWIAQRTASDIENILDKYSVTQCSFSKFGSTFAYFV